MKKLLTILITAALLLIPTACLGQEYRGYSRQNRFTNETEYFDERGKRVGTSRENPFTHERQYFDKDGNRIGTSRTDRFTGEERYTGNKPILNHSE